MKRIVLSIILVLALFISFSGSAGAAAYISPSYQEIKGSSAEANWTFSWSGGSGRYTILFKPDTEYNFKTIDASTTFYSLKHSYLYQENVATKTYKPELMVLDYYDPIVVGHASATVYKKRY